jgi:peptidoglycan/xylan/chitin deacetylase (PgdA/CDA1 family)
MASRAVIDRVMRWSPMQPAFRRRAAGRLTVLAYHGVADPASFRRQLGYLARTMRPVSLDDVAVAGRRGLPQRAVLITFDDGHRSVLEQGVPRLRALGLPAVVFVVAGLLDGDQPPWWQEVEELLGHGGHAGADAGGQPGADAGGHAGADAGGHAGADAGRSAAALIATLKTVPDRERLAVIAELRRTAARPAAPAPQLRSAELPLLESAGVAVGNHTQTHPCLPRCGDEQVAAEIRLAHRRLRAALGHDPTAFAYPNGDWDARAERVLTADGYTAGFLFDHRTSPPTPSHPLRISRVRVNSDASGDRFALLLSGLHPALHSVLGRT